MAKKTSGSTALKGLLEHIGCTITDDMLEKPDALPTEEEKKVQSGVAALEKFRAAALESGLASKDDDHNTMIDKVIKALSGLKEGATALAATLSRVGKKLGIEKDATETLVLERIDTLRAGSVNADEYNKVKSRLEVLEGTEKDRSAKLKVEEYVACGKLNPNDKGSMDWAMTAAKENPDGFDKLMSAAPKLYTPGQVTEPGKGAGANGTRQQFIQGELAEFRAHRSKFNGLSAEHFVKGSISQKGMDPLTDLEVAGIRKEFGTNG